VVENLENSNPSVRLRAVMATGTTPDPRFVDSPAAEVRRRAVEAIAEITDDPATEVLRGALTHPDATVRHRAALALGARGVADAVPTLVDMIVEGVNDAEAADVLGALPASAGHIVDRLADAEPAARGRLTQALGDLPGTSPALADLQNDGDRVVALTAKAILARRG
jgi:HEAT repeat protein